jgi:hypothetical protein
VLTLEACALVVLGALLSACDGSHAPKASDVMAQETERLQWPSAAPSFDAIMRFVRAAGGRTPVSVVAERANACAWYGTWLSSYEKAAPATPAVLGYLTDVIPTLGFVRGNPSAVDTMRQLAAAASERKPESIRTFLQVNNCNTLAGKATSAGQNN